MQEHAVTIGGKRHPLEEPFFVLATENPIEMEGTYPLPEAQLDRFLLKVQVPAPDAAALTDILRLTTGKPEAEVQPILGKADVLALRSLCRDVAAAEPLLSYAARLVTATSPDASDAPPLVRRALRFGAGVRGAQALILAAKAVALLEGRGHVAFADIQRTALPVLRHRVIRSFEGEAEGISTDRVLAELLESVPARPTTVEQAVRDA
jgi:MoxR-like ATPase